MQQLFRRLSQKQSKGWRIQNNNTLILSNNSQKISVKEQMKLFKLLNENYNITQLIFCHSNRSQPKKPEKWEECLKQIVTVNKIVSYLKGKIGESTDVVRLDLREFQPLCQFLKNNGNLGENLLSLFFKWLHTKKAKLSYQASQDGGYSESNNKQLQELTSRAKPDSLKLEGIIVDEGWCKLIVKLINDQHLKSLSLTRTYWDEKKWALFSEEYLTKFQPGQENPGLEELYLRDNRLPYGVILEILNLFPSLRVLSFQNDPKELSKEKKLDILQALKIQLQKDSQLHTLECELLQTKNGQENLQSDQQDSEFLQTKKDQGNLPSNQLDSEISRVVKEINELLNSRKNLGGRNMHQEKTLPQSGQSDAKLNMSRSQKLRSVLCSRKRERDNNNLKEQESDKYTKQLHKQIAQFAVLLKRRLSKEWKAMFLSSRREKGWLSAIKP